MELVGSSDKIRVPTQLLIQGNFIALSGQLPVVKVSEDPLCE